MLITACGGPCNFQLTPLLLNGDCIQDAERVDLVASLRFVLCYISSFKYARGYGSSIFPAELNHVFGCKHKRPSTSGTPTVNGVVLGVEGQIAHVIRDVGTALSTYSVLRNN